MSDKYQMTVAGTGHRLNKLGGYSEVIFNSLTNLAQQWLETLKPSKVISGMALGWDQAIAQAAINLNIPLVAAIPFLGQELKWPIESQEYYHHLLTYADVEYISSPGYSSEKMQIRNKWMVDRADTILAIWDGSKGGTYNCIKYAEEKGKTIINIFEVFAKGK